MRHAEHRFVAINVGTGDAFFLQRRDFSVLVDGGQVRGFPAQFTRATHRSGVDILVCTHNDQDHANGVLEFIEAGYGAGECWLPATWMEALARLLPGDPTREFYESLVEPEGGDRPLPEQVERPGEIVEAGDLEAMLDDEAEKDPTLDERLTYLNNGIAVFWREGDFMLLHAHASDIFATARRIRNIALAASRRQIPIKWFDPSRPPANTADGPLRVINAQPVTRIRRSSLSTRDVLRLTQVNRDSLVLYSPEDDTAPGVLFSADSGFGFAAQLPASRGMIVTAPHHGAADQENLAAYDRLSTEHADLGGRKSSARDVAASEMPGRTWC